MPEFRYEDLFPLSADPTPYRKLPGEVEVIKAGGREVLQVSDQVLSDLTFAAMRDIAHLFRPGHLAQLRAILDDRDASPNDRFVALELLKNANISAGMVLPSCQDTGTAIVIGKKGQYV